MGSSEFTGRFLIFLNPGEELKIYVYIPILQMRKMEVPEMDRSPVMDKYQSPPTPSRMASKDVPFFQEFQMALPSSETLRC